MRTKSLLLLSILVASVSLTGCMKPVKTLDPVEIGPNETAWAIPLDGASQAGQVKFNSVEFLNAKKVSAKRFMIDKVERKTGRFYWDIEWIPATRIVKVDRSLVSREWTDNDKTGTAQAKQGIPVNTKDSIELTVGLSITTSIEEEDASTYLYYHGMQTLAQVTDQNIRSYCVTELNQEISAMTLAEFQQNQGQIYTKLAKDATAFFKTKGISIQYLGNAEGWNYRNQKIQESINASYIAQQDNKTAQMEQEATKTRNATAILTQENENKIKVMKATAEVTAAKALQDAKEAATFQNTLKIALLQAEAQMQMATKWDGKMPANILPSNSPLLMNLGSSTATK